MPGAELLPPGWVSFGRRLTDLAASLGEQTAVVFARTDDTEQTMSWADLDDRAIRAAGLLREHGVRDGSTVVVGLPNCLEHYVATWAAWKLGAMVLPLRWDCPEWERNRILPLVGEHVVVGDWSDVVGAIDSSAIAGVGDLPRPVLDDVCPEVARAIASGGSTGKPKIIRTPAPAAGEPGSSLGPLAEHIGWHPGQVRLIPGPLYHMSPFVMSFTGLFEACPLVLMERFDAARALDLIERHRVEAALLVPTMLQRMARVPGFADRDFSSVACLMSGGAKLPEWVFQAWDAAIGARIWEAYGATEAHGSAIISGEERRRRPGSVGRPFQTVLRICDEDLDEVKPGVVGEIFMRPEAVEGPTFEYVGGGERRVTEDGLASVGDLGWVDEDGYLFIADRRTDMIVTGGANVYPAEVEAALSEHPDVFDVAVIGVADDEWGRAVHALVQPRDPAAPPRSDDLDRHCRERLAPYKVPKSYELVPSLPRNDVGKLQRTALTPSNPKES